MVAVGTGQGKLILFGEHAAVFGHPAIGLQLPDRTTVTISASGSEPGSWDLREIPREDRPPVERLFDRLETLLPDLCAHGRGVVRVESTVPRGIGMGSSAALCSATASAALNLLGKPRQSEAQRTWQLAHELESLFHGTPSGIDTGLSLHDGLSAYLPLPPGLPRWERIAAAPLWLVVGALPRAGASAELIRGIGERMRSGESEVIQAMSALGRAAREARETLAAGHPAAQAEEIGRLADIAMGILRDLGLSNPYLDFLLDEGRRSGALGGKLSGAGGGGAFFLVVENETAAGAAAAHLDAAARSRGIRFAVRPRALLAGR